MAANRFATMLHRNTNKITLILIYAVLEWILIFLLLLNSLFSYMIIKFAEFFGLKPPCLWCTRIDHVLDPAKGGRNMHRDLLCEVHCKEISRLGYCSNHRKLVESEDMCEDCLSSRPEVEGSARNLAVFPWVKGFGVMQRGVETVGENCGVSLNCSCCGVCLDDGGKYSSYALLKTSSLDDLESAQKENLIIDDDRVREVFDDSTEKILDSAADFGGVEKVENIGDSEANEDVEKEAGCVSENFVEAKFLEIGEDVVLEVEKEKETVEEEKSIVIMKDKSVQVCVEEDEIPPQHLEFFLDYSGHTLVPIELVDSMTDELQGEEDNRIEGDDESNDQALVDEREPLVLGGESRQEKKADAFLDVDINEEPTYTMLEVMEMEEDENSLVFHAKDSRFETTFPLARWPSVEVNDDQEMAGVPVEEQSDDRADNNVSCEEAAQENNENEADVSIGTEIPDLDIADEIIQIQDSVHSIESSREDSSTSRADLYALYDDHGPRQVVEQIVEPESLSFEDRKDMKENEPLFQSEVNETEEEEDKFPDTPTSVDSLNKLHKKFSQLEKRDSGTEESLDGSVTSELEGGDGVVTVEGLKAALRSERKALQSLYAELEEERSASAVAANQTMAMINRLQEEKAAMQMEALQYQRMMEEQSEYDQEALQLMNELMVKREREKKEVEKELEDYRKKLFEYETRERVRMLRTSKDGSTRSGFSSASCSNAEDSDGLSIDLNQDAKEEEGSYIHKEKYKNQSTPIDAVVNLEQSLADFEDERMSILEQLKVLEEKLLTLEDEDEDEDEDDDDMEQHFGEENGHHHLNGETNGHANGFAKETTNGKPHHQHRRIAGHKGKSLLPLFNAICDEKGDTMLNGNGVHDSSHDESEFEMENKKLAMEEEVDHLYERLQALEADREFLKHCMSSMKKGDKGMDLLQEILQHLRDLRNVELRARSMGDGAIVV
ncbi:myosin-binding protein 2-like [Salvia splendens]|uniref:myosin-binding protein 2-like n=1 Tax=Salvia splendens TaxID=180675 RepID=UPI001C27E6DA|nr:myosin-binding protein 2-like [Salvia splendens]